MKIMGIIEVCRVPFWLILIRTAERPQIITVSLNVMFECTDVKKRDSICMFSITG